MSNLSEAEINRMNKRQLEIALQNLHLCDKGKNKVLKERLKNHIKNKCTYPEEEGACNANTNEDSCYMKDGKWHRIPSPWKIKMHQAEIKFTEKGEEAIKTYYDKKKNNNNNYERNSSALVQITDKVKPICEFKSTKLEPLYGLEEAQLVLEEEIVRIVKYPHLSHILKTSENGFLLYGPPGNGKTVLCENLFKKLYEISKEEDEEQEEEEESSGEEDSSSEYEEEEDSSSEESSGEEDSSSEEEEEVGVGREREVLPFVLIEVKSSGMQSSYTGIASKRIEELFNYAHFLIKNPVLIFIDELDGFFPGKTIKGENAAELRAIRSELLKGMNLKSNKNVFIIGATNSDPDDLDEAAVRPGRLGKHIHIKNPSDLSICKIIVGYLNKLGFKIKGLCECKKNGECTYTYKEKVDIDNDKNEIFFKKLVEYYRGSSASIIKDGGTRRVDGLDRKGIFKIHSNLTTKQFEKLDEKSKKDPCIVRLLVDFNTFKEAMEKVINDQAKLDGLNLDNQEEEDNIKYAKLKVEAEKLKEAGITPMKIIAQPFHSMKTFRDIGVKRPCYQQHEADCSRFSTRIASEIVLGRKMNKDEAKRFREWGCPLAGDTFDSAVDQFKRLFPSFSDHLTYTRVPEIVTRRRTRRSSSAEEKMFVSMSEIESLLDSGYILLLNIQHMDFRKNEIVEWKGSEGGHCICCIGHDENYLILQDSNKYRGSCVKRVEKRILHDTERRLKTDDLFERLKIMASDMHVTELYAVHKNK